MVLNPLFPHPPQKYQLKYSSRNILFLLQWKNNFIFSLSSQKAAFSTTEMKIYFKIENICNILLVNQSLNE